jgi:hypothetical protein
MSIQACLDELDEISKEIKANNIKNKNLRIRAKELQDNIQTYLTNKEQPGLKYKGKAILLESKEKHMRKKKTEKEADTLAYLESIGVHNPKDAYNKILGLQKGEAYHDKKLMIKDISSSK